MTPLTFLRQEEVREALARASAAAAAPVAIHYLQRGEEGPCIAGVGQCAACRHVHDLPGGVMACRGSRIKASLEALRDGLATPFLCHMGFPCVAAPVFDYRDKVVGSIGISGPVTRITPAKLSEYAELVVKIAEELSQKMRFSIRRF